MRRGPSDGGAIHLLAAAAWFSFVMWIKRGEAGACGVIHRLAPAERCAWTIGVGVSRFAFARSAFHLRANRARLYSLSSMRVLMIGEEVKKAARQKGGETKPAKTVEGRRALTLTVK